MEEKATALVQVNPGSDAKVAALYNEGVKLKEYAESRVIQSDEDVVTATNDLSIIAGLKKSIEELRTTQYTKPLNDHLKAINAAFKDFVAPIEQADTINRRKVQDYRAELERRRQEQERINLLREEAAKAEMALKDEITEPVNLVEVAPVQPKRYIASTGELGTAKIKKWELSDMREVPEEYKMLDSARITKVVKAGIPSIPGIRIYEDEVLRVTAQKPEIVETRPEPADLPFQ